MNCLDLVPAFKRHTKQYILAGDTDSKLAGYLSDAIKALSYRWVRGYTITSPTPDSYIVVPDVLQKDEYPIVLAASIIYKGSLLTGSFSDGDFAFNPVQGSNSSILLDLNELKLILPPVKLATPISAPLYGFNNIYSPEGYNYLGFLLSAGY